MKWLILLVLLLSFISCRFETEKLDYMNIPEYCMKFGRTALQWDTHEDENGDLDGFRIYSGSSNTEYDKFKLVHDIENEPTRTYIMLSELSQPLNSCQTNYIYLTAYSTEDLESDPSNVVCWGMGCPPAMSSGLVIIE